VLLLPVLPDARQMHAVPLRLIVHAVASSAFHGVCIKVVGELFDSETASWHRGVRHMTSIEQPHGSAVAQAEAGSPAANRARNRDAVRSELSQVVDRGKMEARAARSRARAWSRLYFVVGLPAAVLAAVAGAIALASTAGRVAAGIIALVSAGLTAAATFLDSATRQTSYDNLAAGWQVLANDAHLKLVVDVENDEWLTRESRVLLQDLADRERKLLQGKAPDAEAEAERRAQYEAIRAQAEAVRAEAEAERARAAEQAALANAVAAAEANAKGQAIKAAIQARIHTDEPS
jgi:hypothetical protein